MSLFSRASLLLAMTCTLAGCATSVPPQAGPTVLLLGEVHDNADGHARRYAQLQQRVEAGWRPVIAMEQFDRERQAELDAALESCTDADCVIAAATPAKTSWQWPLYKPVITLALQHKLPLAAANLSRADGAKVVREGFASVFDAATLARYRLDQPLPEALMRGQEHEVDVGHCGQLPPAMLPGMARAQIARDVWMAKVLEDHAAQGVVLLAGNGHVRRDLGVPQWLTLPAGRVESVGFVERQPEAGSYDRVVTIASRADRPDPCAGLTMPQK
ncbi:ChaN family lipoprotein [Chitinolyticbacter meiyuanensis]|uniref:ChaN family lipoprotein n=1 Tax=Chitinolyticbacter meiyuanensis TaxID=682798 RepID=UPI0011E5C027|nr:ChaN family lipoprotein [Chitinolyticbacter meiyuanensis]